MNAIYRADIDYRNPPSHVAIVLDGHRRYAAKNGIRIRQAYFDGCARLLECAAWLKSSPVHEMSFFAMGYEITVDEAPRAVQRREDVWDALEHGFSASNAHIFSENRISFRLIGDRTLIPRRVLDNLEALERETAIDNRKRMNLAIGYSHLREIEHAASVFYGGSPVDSSTMFDHLLVTSPVDMFVRTGGVRVLGDFLLTQSAHARVLFLDDAWPEVNAELLDSTLEFFEKHNQRIRLENLCAKEVNEDHSRFDDKLHS